jgi:hypothetical protein
METNIRKVKPVFAHRISIFRIECHHEAIHDFTSLSHGSVDRVGSHTRYRLVDSRKIRALFNHLSVEELDACYQRIVAGPANTNNV